MFFFSCLLVLSVDVLFLAVVSSELLEVCSVLFLILPSEATLFVSSDLVFSVEFTSFLLLSVESAEFVSLLFLEAVLLSVLSKDNTAFSNNFEHFQYYKIEVLSRYHSILM